MSESGRRTLLWKLGLALMTMQAVVGIVLVVYSRNRLQTFHREQELLDLRRVTSLLTDRIDRTYAEAGERGLSAAIADLDAEIGLRLTIIRTDGEVIADSRHDPADMDDHRYRSEIDTAIRSGTGSAIRYSRTLGVDMLYFARLREIEDGPALVVRAAVPLTRVDAELGRSLQAIGLAALGLFVLTLGVIYVVSLRISATVGRIAEGAGRFSAGDLRHRIDPPASRELEALVIALNTMAEQLSNQFAELQAQRSEQRAILDSMSNGMIALDRDQRILSMNHAAETILNLNGGGARGRLLQELVREPALNRFVDTALGGDARTSDELELAGRVEGGTTIEAIAEPLLDPEHRRVGLLVLFSDVTRLRRLESIRSDFAANVSHELRTPITNIKGYVETMLEVGCGDQAQTRQFLGVVRQNATRLESIVEDLLSLSRLEQPGARPGMPLETVEVGGLAEAVASSLRGAAADKNIDVSIDVDPGLSAGAAQLIEQAVSNLLSNAVNYSPSGTRVTITARPLDEDLLEIAVTDEGPGIAPEHLPRLFERFYRVDQARSRSLGGTGLGLAIVKHIALVHGGRAEVESEVGRGSVFRVVLPRASYEAPTPPITRDPGA